MEPPGIGVRHPSWRREPGPGKLPGRVRHGYLALTSPVNLAGLPALALKVPGGQRLPASLQLIGGPGAESLLLATGAAIEAAVGGSGQSSMAW